MRIVYFIIISTFTFKISKNQGLSNSLANLSHENLLDNSWFTVNQRNFSSSNSVGYTVDRWHLIWNPNGCTVTKTANGLSIDNTQSGAGITYIFQKFESKDIVGKTLTATLLLSDGTLLKGTGVMPQLDGAIVTPISDQARHIGVSYQHSTTGSSRLCAFRLNIEADCSLTIKAIKLELGSISTLAMDTAPNYATELLKCQRYFYRISIPIYQTAGMGISNTGNGIIVTFYTPVNMRVKPSVSTDGNLKLRNGSSFIPITSNIIYGDDDSNRFDASFTTESGALTIGTVYQLYTPSHASYLDFSADL